ncbi:bleomycin resistance protein [Streptomyces uncialis]|uniref:bleomycin resistance protein n=1 Tax=Streptomyces uncialis TaxID=1048205 RepID=UPI0022589609|nr:VOC family protein [Streptomyces uncialis]MCX4661728.1 VOC family protein [Streptomyces uncialis]
MAEKTIPLLPCRSELIEPLLDFYTALGFGTTFHQKSPYAYVVVERGTVELQFLGMKEYDPAASYSGCYILTDDVEGLYEAFRSGLKSAYGRIPARGLPRIGPLKDMSYGVRQFLMTDPTGNSIRIGQPISDDGSHRPLPAETFARALHLADLFVDSKEDLPGAVRIVDRALAQTGKRPTPAQSLRLLVLRGDLAQRLGDDGTARSMLDRAASVAAADLADPAAFAELTEEERGAVRDALARLAELRG